MICTPFGPDLQSRHDPHESSGHEEQRIPRLWLSCPVLGHDLSVQQNGKQPDIANAGRDRAGHHGLSAGSGICDGVQGTALATSAPYASFHRHVTSRGHRLLPCLCQGHLASAIQRCRDAKRCDPDVFLYRGGDFPAQRTGQYPIHHRIAVWLCWSSDHRKTMGIRRVRY